MATNDLGVKTIPVLLLDGSLEYPSISPSTTAQDLVDTLCQLDAVKCTVTDATPVAWLLQRVRRQKPGRLWDESELLALGDGVLEPASLIAPLLNGPGSDSTDASQKQFSTFPLTSRLHVPVLRLVTRHPLHSLSLSFLLIPEINDGFKWTVFFGKDATVKDVINDVVQELGLFKALPSSRGGGQVEYVLEVLSGNQATQLPESTRMIDALRSYDHQLTIRFCIPDQWFRRKPRSSTTQSRSSSSTDASSRAETGSSADEDGEGTARQSKSSAGSPEWRGSVAQSRLTSLLAGWSQPAPATTSEVIATPTGNRKSVSEPLLVQQNTGGSFVMGGSVGPGDVDLEEFERCLDLYGVKGDARSHMHSFPPEKKQQFMDQVRGNSVGVNPQSPPTLSATYGPSSGSGLFRLGPQLSGESSFFKRLSMFPTWGSTTSPPPTNVNPKGHLSGEFVTNRGLSAFSDRATEGVQPIQPQTTGSMFGTWLTILGGDAIKDNEHSISARSYVDGIRKSRNVDSRLAKHLISLRVHLSTAKLPWIETFIAEEGIIAISGLLSSLVGKGGKRKALSDSENSVLLEVIKSLRVLLNTEPGFDAVLLSPTIVTHIAYSLHGTSLKIRTLAAEILAAICVVSFDEGHRAVLAALSEYRVAYNELFRFHSLVTALKIPDYMESAVSDTTFPMDGEGVWEARTAFMALINALTNCPHTLEERIVLRDELSRRGLNEVIVALRYIKPPDSLLKQLDMYTEEKYEDEEDFRERARRAVRDSRRRSIDASEPSVLFDEIMHTAVLLDAGSTVESILRKLHLVVQGPFDSSFKTEALSVMDDFVGGIATVGDSEQAWTFFVQGLVVSVQRLSGRIISFGNIKTLEEEIHELRNQLEDLTRENDSLKNGGGHRHRKEGSAVYIGSDLSVPIPSPTPTPKQKANSNSKAGNEIVSSLAQRLTQKEKEVIHLRGELDRLKPQHSGEANDSEDRARRERERAKLNSLTEEVTTLKERISKMDDSLSNKDKEALYIRRAFESVHSRLHPKNGEATNNMDVQLLVSQCLDKLSETDAEVVALRTEVQVLKQSLSGRSKEQAFKANNPPPPPPTDRTKATVSKASTIRPPAKTETVDDSGEMSPPPPPPPPPPPGLVSPGFQPLSSESLTSPSPLPPPPPPPLPPLFEGDVPPPPPPPLLPPILRDGVPLPPPPPPPPPGGKIPPPAMYARSRPKQSGPRLKPFFWNKLDGNVIGPTVWSESSLAPEFQMDDLESMFTIDTTPHTPSRVAKSTGRQNVTTLLETTRANNMAIMLSRFKIGYPAIRQALLDLDDTVLSIDELRAISKQLPTTEEMTRIKDFGDVTKLANADRFIHEIISIPRLPQRLECMIFRRRFELDVEEIRPDLETLRDACRELRTSQLFKRTLQVILIVGNRLNGSSFRGGARGFRLEALLKMKETKTAKATADCPTLLHYVARVLLRAEPKLTLFMDELPNLEPAARISFQTISQAVQSAIASRTKVEAEIKWMKQRRNPTENDQFVNIMQEFIVRVSDMVDALKGLTTSVENDLRSLFRYYGESLDTPDGLKPEDFFGMICSFSSSLQKAAVDVAPRTPTAPPPLDNKHETAKHAEPMANNLLAPPSRQERQRTLGRGDLDEALRTLKDGQTRRQRSTPSSVRVPMSKVFIDGRQDSGRVELQVAAL